MDEISLILTSYIVRCLKCNGRLGLKSPIIFTHFEPFIFHP